jgi:hypothetical protein
MDSTPRLALPDLLRNHAKKHVTVNEAFKALDVMIGRNAHSRAVAAQPASPAEGDTYILLASIFGTTWATFPEANVVAVLDGAGAISRRRKAAGPGSKTHPSCSFFTRNM